jgi:nicotinate-nucleotide pyrophosphorylase (carboxylating)
LPQARNRTYTICMITLPLKIAPIVTAALTEDIGSGDLSALLIPADRVARAQILSREAAVLCGVDFAREVFLQVDPLIVQHWLLQDGDRLQPDQVFCELEGSARSLLTAERTALNFLQTLSATATRTAYFVDLIKDTNVILLDTRKTIPGLRSAQKYAVVCGGGVNHRQGLFDAVLIKENHILACGSIAAAIKAHQVLQPGVKMMIEVENIDELKQAIDAGAMHILCDNFSIAQLQEAIALRPSQVKLEASGGIDESNIRHVALTGVDYISLGTLTKDIRAIDLSMRFL